MVTPIQWWLISVIGFTICFCAVQMRGCYQADSAAVEEVSKTRYVPLRVSNGNGRLTIGDPQLPSK